MLTFRIIAIKNDHHINLHDSPFYFGNSKVPYTSNDHVNISSSTILPVILQFISKKLISIIAVFIIFPNKNISSIRPIHKYRFIIKGYPATFTILKAISMDRSMGRTKKAPARRRERRKRDNEQRLNCMI